MNVRITQIDGALPNLALMRLSSFHKQCGDTVHFTRSVEPDLFEPEYDKVYASTIFSFSGEKIDRLRKNFPNAVIGGTGSFSQITTEDVIGEHAGVDYSGFPEFDASIGFTQRGCRLKCKFCVVPTKEGKNRSVNTIAEIWRGVGYPKKIHLLDNDFFGQQQWRERVAELRDGKFKVCLSQGINARLIDDESAQALASLEYRNTKFNERVLYTAWDNLKDEAAFFRGVDTLEKAGIPPSHLITYMLIGYDPTETKARLWHRFNRMVERGIRPYPMVFNQARKDLKVFQRWAIMGLYRVIPWAEYEPAAKLQGAI